MKIRIKKDLLVNVLEKMHNVSTKALLPDFSFSGKVTVETQGSRILFTSSNGCITARIAITESDDPGIKGCDKGVFTVDSVKFRDSVRKIGTNSSSSPIELYDDGNVVLIRNPESNRKKLVKLPRENTHHKSNIIAPDGDHIFMETEHFLRGVKTVLPFETSIVYHVRYQVACFHWIKKETRMVCGDGGQFAIFTVPRSSKDTTKREIKRTIPCSQLSVVSSLIIDSTELDMVWQDKTVLWIKADNVELLMRGLPDLEYVAYHTNAYRFNEASAYADIKVSDLKEVMNLLGALHDKERENQGNVNSCCFEVPSSDGNAKFEIAKDQGKFQCEYEIPAAYYNLGKRPVFKARYAQLFFDSPVRVARHPYIRFYFLDDAIVSNARDVDLGNPDDNGIPVIKNEEDNCSLSFFFAEINTNDEEE